MKPLTSGKARDAISISALKNENHEIKLRHADSPNTLKSWEQKFDDELVKRVGKQPGHHPACVPDLEQLLVRANVQATDLREKGGALWVLTEDQSSKLARRLKDLGFAHRSGRGWYRE